MSKLAQRAEIIKLGRLLDRPEHELEFLYRIPAPALQAYREAAEQKMFSDDITLFRRLALASKLIPTGLIGFLGQHLFGAMLSARVAGELETQRAVKLAMKLPVGYLADICLHLDPRRAEDIIRNIPADRIREVSLELLARAEYITMGRFVGYVTDEALAVAIPAFENEADLLMTGFFVEDKPRLDTIIRTLSDERLRKTIVAAQSEHQNLWAEAVALMMFVGDDLKGKLGDMTAEQDPEVLEGLLATAHEQQLWSEVLPVVACMSPQSQRKVSELPALTDRDVMTPILETAHAQDLWHTLLPLVETMPSAQIQTAASALTEALPHDALENVLQEAAEQNLWTGLLPLFDAMGPEQAQRIGSALAVLPDTQIQQAVHSTDENELWHCLLPLARHMPGTELERIARVIAELPHESLERLVAAAAESDNDLQSTLLNMLEQIPEHRREMFEEVLQPYLDGKPLPAKPRPATTPSRPTDNAAAERAAPASTSGNAGDTTPTSARAGESKHPATDSPPSTGAQEHADARPFGVQLPGVLGTLYRQVEDTVPVNAARSFLGLDDLREAYARLQTENAELRSELTRARNTPPAETPECPNDQADLEQGNESLRAQLRRAEQGHTQPAPTPATQPQSSADVRTQPQADTKRRHATPSLKPLRELPAAPPLKAAHQTRSE